MMKKRNNFPGSAGSGIIRLVTLIALTINVAPQAVYANDITEYQFDIILFENIPSKQQYLADHSAQEFLRLNRPDTRTVTEGEGVYKLDESLDGFQIQENGELDDAMKRLVNSKQYKVLFRKTWKQSALADNASIQIKLADTVKNPATKTFKTNGVESISGNPVEQYLTGTLNLRFSRYIHLKTDIYLHHDTETTGNIDTPVEYQRSSQVELERKMRSNETHYIDHPLLGILVNIQRIEADKV